MLTAVHCLKEKLLSEIQVIIGSIDLREGRKYDVKKWITYNQWAAIENITKKRSVNDIAVMKVNFINNS